MKTWISWSSGKDSAYALHVARASGEFEIAGLLTTVTAEYDRVSMHAVRRELLEAQADRLGLPLHVVEIPAPCSNEIYAERMGAAIEHAQAEGVQSMVFGDIFLEDVREYREAMMAGCGIKPRFPLWGRDPKELAHAIIGSGVRAHLTCVDPRKVGRQFAGRSFDDALLAELPALVDPCGENGEFHTFVWDSPDFSHAVEIDVGAVVEREGFVFCDLSPRPPTGG